MELNIILTEEYCLEGATNTKTVCTTKGTTCSTKTGLKGTLACLPKEQMCVGSALYRVVLLDGQQGRQM